MEDNWVNVFITTEEYKAERIKILLMDAGIPAEILSHKDSAFVIGDITVMVNDKNRERAEAIIKDYR